MSATAAITARIPRRSMGLKLLLVCLLALLMSIPALTVFALLSDRTTRAKSVSNEIAALIGGQQQFLGPILAIPYTAPPQPVPAAVNGQVQQFPAPTQGVYIVYPQTGHTTADIKTSVRKRGLFKATVWNADLVFTSNFDLTAVGAQAPKNAVLDWSKAEFLVGASDARGAQSDIIFNGGGKRIGMNPAVNLGGTNLDLDDRQDSGDMPLGIRFFGASAAPIAVPGAKFEVSASGKFAGAQRLSLLPYAKTTTFHATGDWSAPSFNGGFLPRSHGANPAMGKGADGKLTGFVANWSVPFIARGVTSEGTSDILSPLGPLSLGVTFVDAANPYQAVSRSLKYALMFVGLVFLAYFLFETVQKKRVHPAQYVLIGLAQVIFYLLLLAIAERVGFDLGFLIAASATVALISAYAGWVFESRKQGFVALAAFTALYGLIYVLMRLEDWALLVGAVTSFAAIAVVMYFTRNIDWYGGASADAAPQVKEGV